jgi:hypothetical protein
MVDSRQDNWVATKNVLNDLRDTIEHGLRYLGYGEVKLQGNTYLDWVGNAMDMKSTLGCCSRLGSIVIYWFKMKHVFMSLNLAEAK